MSEKRSAASGRGFTPCVVGDAQGTIGFRLDEPARRALAERAAQLRVSPHELARAYVLELLYAGEDRALLRDAVRRLDSQVKALQVDLLRATEGLLVSAGRVSPNEARQWIERNFH